MHFGAVPRAQLKQRRSVLTCEKGSSGPALRYAEGEIAVDGGRLTLSVVEPDQAISMRATLICVHGWTLDARSFQQQSALATQGLRVVSYDRRGFGLNTMAPDFAAELSDLAAIVRAFNKPVVLWGVSQGARLVLRFIAHHASAVSAAIAQGGHIDGIVINESADEAIPFQRFTELVARGDLSQFQREWLQHSLITGGFDEGQRWSLGSLIDRYSGADLLQPESLPQPCDLRALLSAQRTPLLSLSGSLDSDARRQQAKLLVSLAGAEHCEVSGGGHLCNISHAATVNAAVNQWLSSVGL